MRTKLIGSAPSKEQLLDLISRYLFNSNRFILLEDLENKGIFTLWYPENSPRAGKQLTNYIIKNKKGRFRLELILEGK